VLAASREKIEDEKARSCEDGERSKVEDLPLSGGDKGPESIKSTIWNDE